MAARSAFETWTRSFILSFIRLCPRALSHVYRFGAPLQSYILLGSCLIGTIGLGLPRTPNSVWAFSKLETTTEYLLTVMAKKSHNGLCQVARSIVSRRSLLAVALVGPFQPLAVLPRILVQTKTCMRSSVDICTALYTPSPYAGLRIHCLNVLH